MAKKKTSCHSFFGKAEEHKNGNEKSKGQ